MSGLEWLNIPKSDSVASTPTPPPSVSFGARQPPPPPPRTDSDVSSSWTTSDVPLSLTVSQLSPLEARTYLRWYGNILSRSLAVSSQYPEGLKKTTIALAEIWTFFTNFKLQNWLKERLEQLFLKYRDSLNVGQFFALLRMVGHYYLDDCVEASIDKTVIQRPAPIPKPIGILSTAEANKRKRDLSPEPEPKPDSAPLDLDSFTRFMLTGVNPQESRKKKAVKFSEMLVTGSDTPESQSSSIDLSLPMDQLLGQANGNANFTLNHPVTMMNSPHETREEEAKILKEMSPEIHNFDQVSSIDSMSLGGKPANVGYSFLSFSNDSDMDLTQDTDFSDLKPLKPNMTGPNEMRSLGIDYKSLHKSQIQAFQQDAQLLKPNRTGPNDMQSMGVDYQALRNLQGLSTPSFFVDQSQPSQIPVLQRHRSLSSPMPSQISERNHSLHLDFLNSITSSINPSPAIHSPLRNVSSPLELIRGNQGPNQAFSQGSNQAFSQMDQPFAEFSPQKNGGLAPPPPPPRSRRMTASPVLSPMFPPPPPPRRNVPSQQSPYGYQNATATGSGSELLDDLARLKQDLERIKLMTGETTNGY
ncbi:hypothetical protein BABINDRAFT_5450 [Babjeviella inositovora NRRL Y-12698]|uniref:Uncharacterized protein n=1 Tax=Babjeviella inositovora NRRL Y-12698 TaxID=984486 RepID=A0A1E3QY11_9ASCO|nr:uncharacterized protein BABINDRAFT_5450 [Babjeviella inositovora NRRL Y-12698]ODQ82491.1 hypothetical protein BABINDRAFT_5450 [Babjeviella inositovora NRRL Y-12698]